MTRTAWHLTPRWLRNLAVDADIYGDAALLVQIERARRGDEAALAACRRESDRIASE